MVNLVNPVSQFAAFAMKASSVNLADAGLRLATGSRGTSNTVDYIVGSGLQDGTTVLKSVVKGSAYGINLLKVAQAKLVSAEMQIVELRDIAAQANTTNPAATQSLGLLAIANIKALNNQLLNAAFDTRILFDGVVAGTVANAGLNIRVDLGTGVTVAISKVNLNIVNAAADGFLLNFNDASLVGFANAPGANQATQANVNAADALFVTSLGTVTAAIATIGGNLQTLKNSQSDLNNTIQVQSAAADSYLKTNYEDDSAIFKEAVLQIRGSIATTAQGYAIADATLQLLQ